MMGHPDAAWNPNYYEAPIGLGDNEPCRHVIKRVSSTSTGRARYSILGDSCSYCGRIMRSAVDISWSDYIWVRRWNQRIK
jgi:hypothetical protein